MSQEFDKLAVTVKYVYTVFIGIMVEAVRANIPKKVMVSNGKHRNPIAWLDDECSKLIRLRKAALKKWRHTPEIIDYDNYKTQIGITQEH